jgi:hypothetical protein
LRVPLPPLPDRQDAALQPPFVCLGQAIRVGIEDGKGGAAPTQWLHMHAPELQPQYCTDMGPNGDGQAWAHNDVASTWARTPTHPSPGAAAAGGGNAPCGGMPGAMTPAHACDDMAQAGSHSVSQLHASNKLSGSRQDQGYDVHMALAIVCHDPRGAWTKHSLHLGLTWWWHSKRRGAHPWWGAHAGRRHTVRGRESTCKPGATGMLEHMFFIKLQHGPDSHATC